MCDKKEDKDMAISEKKLQELRSKIAKMNKDIPVLKSGKNGAVELDMNNSNHRKWYEGK